MMFGATVKRVFWESAGVVKAFDQATRRVLGRFGAGTRRAALAEIKEAPPDVHAPAGSAPFSHRAAVRRVINARRKASGKPKARGLFGGLRFILYALDPSARSVVIGPASNRTRSITIPEILEEGRLEVPKHPFMGPAFEQQKTRLPSLWAGSLSK
jgi:hypothetical protein